MSPVVDDPLGIRLTQMSAVRGAIKLEADGLTRSGRGRSVTALWRDELGLPRTATRDEVLEALEWMGEAINLARGQLINAGLLTLRGKAITFTVDGPWQEGNPAMVQAEVTGTDQCHTVLILSPEPGHDWLAWQLAHRLNRYYGHKGKAEDRDRFQAVS